LDERSLQLIEYFRVTAAMAERALSVRGREALRAWRPIADATRRRDELDLLSEAIRRSAEPASWCAVGSDDLLAALERLERQGPDGETLFVVAGWLEAADRTAAAWAEAELRARHPRLSARVPDAEPVAPLQRALAAAIDERGQILDAASPTLRRLRSALETGERRLMEHLEKWAHAPWRSLRGHGPGGGIPTSSRDRPRRLRQRELAPGGASRVVRREQPADRDAARHP
jgi:DNA mismatch repair protein MutS2